MPLSHARSLGTKQSPLQTDKLQMVPPLGWPIRKRCPILGVAVAPEAGVQAWWGTAVSLRTWAGPEVTWTRAERLVWSEGQLVLARAFPVTHSPTRSPPSPPACFHHIYFLSFSVLVESPPYSRFFRISLNCFPAIEPLNILNFSNFCNLEIYTLESLNNCICLPWSRHLRLWNSMKKKKEKEKKSLEIRDYGIFA